MATREGLNKLKIDALRQLAADIGIQTEKKKKQELLNEILNFSVAPSVLTPVLRQSFETDALFPNRNENLPPFNKVSYNSIVPRIPTITFSMIYEFMISRSTDTGANVNNFKGLDRAVQHYEAGDVKDVAFSQVNETTLYVKALCHASWKKQDYQVFLCISIEETGDTINYAYCQCVIGLAQSCSHIGALLFVLSHGGPKDGPEAQQSSTSMLCQWVVPRSNAKPRPFEAIAATQRKPGQTTDQSERSATDEAIVSPLTNFDPRHSEDRMQDPHWTLQQLVVLRDIFPKTGISHLWNVPDHVPEACCEEEMEAYIDPLHLQMESMLFTKENLPPPIIDHDLVGYIENYTRGQRSSDMWKRLHVGRITSSMFGDVLRAGPDPKSLVKQILEGSSLEKYTNLPLPVKWGVDMEERARADYSQLKHVLHEQFMVESTGLTLCASHSFLGASSDGRVHEGGDIGVLEIKCPFSLQGRKVNDMEISDILALSDSSFCLEASSDGPRLRRTHKYFAQVQGEMALMGLAWCDFVVWTAAEENNICIDRVQFDAEFVMDMLPKLVQFYMNHVYPKYYEE